MKAILHPLLLALLSCSDPSSDRSPEVGTSPSAPAQKTEQKATPAMKQPENKLQGMLFEDRLFRSSRGDVIALVPWLEPDSFSVVPSPPTMEQEFIFIYSGTQQQYSGYIALFAFPPKTSEEDAFSVMHEVFAKGLGLAPTGDKKSLNLFGGATKQQALAGQLPNGTKMSGETLVIVDSGATAGVLITSVVGSEGQFGAAKKDLIDSIRVGSKVPTLSVSDPGTPLEGFYRGPLDRNAEFTWMVFDPRGYVSDALPGLLSLDLPVLYQRSQNVVGTYNVTGGKLTITWPGLSGSRRTSVYTFAQEGNVIRLDDASYTRVDGPACDGLKLSGRYEATSFSSLVAALGGASVSASSSSSFTFSPDGTFSTKSSVSVTGTNVSPTGEQSPLMTSYVGDKDKGAYRIEKNLIHLTFGDGTKQTRTFFPRRLDENGRPKPEGYIINGITFLLDK